ncbi:MAG: ABC transporter ATP-binding protein [Clostridiales bacterium]|nr:ABC transporter ATP-binding protein [Clostridiales bacterium]
MSNIVIAEGLSKTYDVQPVLQNLRLQLPAGKIIGLLGPNGCGKTTFMKILAGLIGDYEGNVTIDGRQPGEYTKSIVSYLPEKTYLSDWMKVKDALDLFQDFYADFNRPKAEELLQRFQLSPDMKLKAMSKGMQEKVQLILVMCRSAKLYILDEPLSGVDPAARSVILDTIIRNYSEESTVLFSTHLIYDVEQIFDDIVMLGYGQVIMAGEADVLRQQNGKSIDQIFREVFRC